MTDKIDVVTIGESMVLFQPLQPGMIQYAPLLEKSVGGAESNLAMALARLGKRTRWISRVGKDPFASIILSTLAGEGVDVSKVIRDDQCPTAVFFKETKGYGDPSVYYYRKGSAASRLSPEDLEDGWFEHARHLHVTGITPALGEHTFELTKQAMEQAKNKGMTVSFDPNIRKKLWSEANAKQKITSLIPLADIFMPGKDEAVFLLGEGRTDMEYLNMLYELGPSIIAMKLGEDGSAIKYGEVIHTEPAHKVAHIVDTVGAGDAFAAGFLSVLLDLENVSDREKLIEVIPEASRRANVMGALATQFKGDWEGAPDLDEVNSVIKGKDILRR